MTFSKGKHSLKEYMNKMALRGTRKERKKNGGQIYDDLYKEEALEYGYLPLTSW